jgi:hypothetical protein
MGKMNILQKFQNHQKQTLKRVMRLSFSLLATTLLATEPNLHYFLKSDNFKVKLKNSLDNDIYMNTLDVDRYATQKNDIGDERFNLIDTVSLKNAIEFDLLLTETFILSTSYNYNINDYKIKEKNSDITLAKGFGAGNLAIQYQNSKSIDMQNNDNFLDSDIYSVIFKHTPHTETFNKRLKVKLDWIKNKSKYKIDNATVLRAKYKDGSLKFELNMRFATD